MGLHGFRGSDLQQSQNIFDDNAGSHAQGQTGLHQRLFLALDTAGVVELVEEGSGVDDIVGQTGGVIVLGSADDLLRQGSQLADQFLFLAGGEQIQFCGSDRTGRNSLGSQILENAADPGVGILDIVDGVLTVLPDGSICHLRIL